MKQHWSGGIEIKQVSLPPSRYEAWVRKQFEPFPPEVRDLGITKWLLIRKWHLAEREVWRALYRWSTMRTSDGRERGAQAVLDAYKERNTAYEAATKAHWPCARATNATMRKRFPAEAVEMLMRHPGAYPPRH